MCSVITLCDSDTIKTTQYSATTYDVSDARTGW
jgi:hypothetical protein